MIPGIQYDDNAHGAAIFSNPDDGIEYYGELMMSYGIVGPFILAERYKTTHPIAWFLKGAIVIVLEMAWLFTIGIWVGMAGLILNLAGESYHDMQKRSDRRR